MIKSQYGTIKSINKTSQNRKEAIKSLLVQNEKLKKKAELGEHYKHLYSEVKKQKDDLQKEMDYIDDYNRHLKKQKDDVVEYIKKYDTIRAYYEYEECGYDEYNYDDDFKEDLLRMLGEIE